MRKVDYERLARYDPQPLRELEDSMAAQLRREIEAKKAEETRKAKKGRKKRFGSRN